MKKDKIKTKENIKKHNGIISFWKFAFAMMIVIYHTAVFGKSEGNTLFANGYIGVEFFFLVSGYFLFKTALNKKDEDSFDNLGKETFQFLLKSNHFFHTYYLLELSH